WIARSNCSRPAGGALAVWTVGQSPGSKSIGTPCSVSTSPLVGCAAPGSMTSRKRPGARYSSQSTAVVYREMASSSFGTTREPVDGSSVKCRGRPVGSSTCSIASPCGPRTLETLTLPVAPIGTTSNRSPGSSSAPVKTDPGGVGIHVDYRGCPGSVERAAGELSRWLHFPEDYYTMSGLRAPDGIVGRPCGRSSSVASEDGRPGMPIVG